MCYELYQDFVVTTATIRVTQRQVKAVWSRPGTLYGVDLRTTNKGPPYADTVIISEHYRSNSK